MKSYYNLEIKTPCSENFDAFSKTEKGGFCNSCEKEVVDFTTMNSNDIINYFKTKNESNTCGRFYAKQLDQNSVSRQKRSRFSFVSGIGLTCLSLFSFLTAKAQTNSNTSDVSADANLKVQTITNENNIVVKGTITDSEIPLPGVSIILEGTSIGTQSDFDGNFEFPKKLKKGDVLVFSYIGMKSQKITIVDKDSALNIALSVNMMSDIILMGRVATKHVFKSKRN